MHAQKSSRRNGVQESVAPQQEQRSFIQLAGWFNLVPKGLRMRIQWVVATLLPSGNAGVTLMPY